MTFITWFIDSWRTKLGRSYHFDCLRRVYYDYANFPIITIRRQAWADDTSVNATLKSLTWVESKPTPSFVII